MGIVETIIVIWLLILASINVIRRAVADLIVQITDPDPDRVLPSVAERKHRFDLAQMQVQATGAPGVQQAVADRLAFWIAHPPAAPGWMAQAKSYFGTLLADQFAHWRRKHADKEDDKRGGPRCWRCDVGRPTAESGLCSACAPVVATPCGGCGHLKRVADMENGKCSACRPAPASPAPPPPRRPQPKPADDGPARLSVPAWLNEPTPTGRKS
jgi:hypothetical protein